MLGQDGDAGRRVLSPAEAQQGGSCRYTAMHNASQNLIAVFVSLSQGEEEEEEGEQEEKVREASCLSPTHGGGKGAASKQADGGACCICKTFLQIAVQLQSM